MRNRIKYTAYKKMTSSRYVLFGGSLVFFLCMIIYALTNLYLVLGIPFVLAIIAFVILDFKSFYWLFLLTIPFSATIYFFHDTFSTTVPDEQMTWILLSATILILAYNYKAFPEWFFRNRITLIIALELIWMLVAVAFSQELFPSVKYAASKFWFINAYFLLPVLIFRERKDFKTALLLLAIPITLHAFFVFGWHYTLNFGYKASNKVVKPFYQNHVDYSTTLSMIFPLLYVAWKLCKGRKVWRWILGITILFYLPAIAVASARAAILAVCFAFFMGFMIRKKWVNVVMPTGYAFLLLMVFFLAHNNYFIRFEPTKKFNATQPTFEKAVTGMFTGRDMSSMERFYRWIAVVRMSTDRPVFGVGPNNFYDYYKPYTVSTFATWVSRNDEKSTTHNYFLYMLAEQGWPAMILYGLLIIFVFAEAQKVYHRTDDKFYKYVTLGLAMAFAAGFVNNFFSELIDTHKVGALFYLSIAGIVIIEHLTRPKPAPDALIERPDAPNKTLN